MQTIDAIDLDDVTGGGFLRSIFSGALQGLASSVQSGSKPGDGSIWKSVLSGAIQGGANDLVSRIQGSGGQSA